jgi:hypothetical protein
MRTYSRARVDAMYKKIDPYQLLIRMCQRRCDIPV